MAAFTSIFLVLLLCNSYTLVGSLNDEGYVLLSFKQSIVEDPSASLKNWNSSDRIPCLWTGITCKEERVVSLSFPKTELKGFLPSSLGLLSMLRHLNLRNNNFYGSLPVELFQAQGLQSLVLYGNHFSGSVPHEIGKLINLQILDLSQNFFNGSLPISIHQCRRLKTLDVSRNNFSGCLPIGLSSSLISLEKLDLSFNKLNGSIPDDMGNFCNLKGTVDFSHNLFSGKIPASLGNLPEKVYIDLSYNNLSGSIPQNAALINRGPTAFIGNPELCGPPLKNLCSSKDTGWSSPSSFSFLPDSYNPPGDSNYDSTKRHKRRGLSKSAVIAIVVGNIIGICLIGLLISYCYSRMCMNKNWQDGTNYGFEKEVKAGKASLCFRKDESETPSDNPEQHDLMPLDNHVSFDLDELLKASAFVIGKSGIGIMYKVVLEGGLNLAVRRLGEGGSQRFKEFQTEVEAIGKLRHPNIVSLRAYYWSVDEKLLIYDYMPNGNLANAIHVEPGSPSFKPLSWSSRLKIMRGAAKGLVYLHEFSPKKYVHGDLKPKNILLGPNMDAHISDFGLGRLANIAGGLPMMQSSRVSSDKQQERQLKSSEANTFISSPKMGSYYQAPEVLKVVKPSQKWDVYSFGVIMLLMITGKSTITQKDSSEMDLVQWIQRCFEEKQQFSDVLDPQLAQEIDAEEEILAVLKIAMACANGSPERRPTMRQVTDALERLNVSAEVFW